MKKTLIILTGPTAVGKTKASIELAKAVGVTAATLNFKLNGRSEFSVSELISVSEALGTDYYSLIELAAEREARDKKGQK